MTVSYNCEIDLKEYPHVTKGDLRRLKTKLDSEGYNYYYDNDKLIISGELDEEDVTAEEVSSHLTWILWNVAEIDADATAEAQYADDDYPAAVGVGSYHAKANSNWHTW